MGLDALSAADHDEMAPWEINLTDAQRARLERGRKLDTSEESDEEKKAARSPVKFFSAKQEVDIDEGRQWTAADLTAAEAMLPLSDQRMQRYEDAKKAIGSERLSTAAVIQNLVRYRRVLHSEQTTRGGR